MIDLSYKITIRISEPALKPTDERGQKVSSMTQVEKPKPDRSVDPRLEEVLAHARELASTWQPDTTYQSETPYRKMPFSQRTRKSRRRVRDLFLTSLSLALALGAILLVLLHTFAPTASATKTYVAVSVPLESSPANQYIAHLTKPALATWIYEAGIYSTLASAKSAVEDYRASGVQPVIAPWIASAGAGAKGRYTLLLGSTINPKGSTIYSSWLNHAQVPYFIRPWILQTQKFAFRQAIPTTLQMLLSTDVKMLEALIAMNSGYEVTTINTLAMHRQNLRQQITSQAIKKSTGAQTSILRFDEAVLHAWQAQHNAGPYGTMLQLAKAITSYTQIR